MGPVLGGVLPFALGVAVSPLPVIAAILMLLSARARVTALGFLAGWLLGIVVAVTLFSLISAVIPERDPDQARPVVGVLKILLGLLLLVLSVRQWSSRPRGGAEPPMPKWMAAIDSMTFVRALLLGTVLVVANPKNLMMSASAGLVIGAGGLDAGRVAIAIVVFTALASATVWVPVVVYLSARQRMQSPLETAKRWLTHNNTAVMAVLLLVLGVSQIGNGISSF